MKTIGIGFVVGLFLILAVGYVKRDALFWKVPPRYYEPVVGWVDGFRVDYDVMIPMRDGVRLAADIYYPTQLRAPLAAVLIRTPYNKERSFRRGRNAPISFVKQGYVVVVQDVRGKFHSEGVFTPYRGDSGDSSDTVSWLARQPWSNGRVGTFGCSSGGEVQLLLARERNPHHAALIAMSPGGALGLVEGRPAFGGYEGGIFNLASAFGWFVRSGGKTPGAVLDGPVDDDAVWGLPSAGLVRRYRSDATDFEDYLSKPFSDPYWKSLGYIKDEDSFATPGLIVDAWSEGRVADTLILAERMRSHWKGAPGTLPPHVVIAPGTHCDFWSAAETGRIGDLAVSPVAAQPYDKWIVEWFDYLLRDNVSHKPKLPAYRFYMLGEDRWFDADQWPPRGVNTRRWYLRGDGPANTAQGKGVLSAEPPPLSDHHDEFAYDPADPVPSCGGAYARPGAPACQAGHVDQREVESRNDVLVYTSAPLRHPVRIAGPLSADLHVSSNVLDTDFVARLVDVRPDGTAINIQEGALRMRYRNGYLAPTRMQPGQIYRVAVDMRAIAYYLPAGHRLRLQITSSSFPRLERNLNTGGNNYDETVGVVAVNRVHASGAYPSSVVIPEWEAGVTE